MVKAVRTLQRDGLIYAEFRRNIGQLNEEVWYVMIGHPHGYRGCARTIL